MNKETQNRKRFAEVLIHLFSWGILFGYPILAQNNEIADINWIEHLKHIGVLLFCSFIIFYLNYFFLIPKLLFNNHIQKFLIHNLLAIICLSIILRWWHGIFTDFDFSAYNNGMNVDASKRMPMPPPPFLFIFNIRDTFTMILSIGLSVAIQFVRKWKLLEDFRRETEQVRIEIELKNLRHQLNPHFLLNTLNNIYALIAFNTEKAQTAVIELSKLLRHMLYENQNNFVPLSKELDFIKNYIELMKIRLTDSVKVETTFEVSIDSQTLIAPVIFIPLIENAFKHGISPTDKSYIKIIIGENNNEIYCNIRNSYHPKTTEDKSGSGIGLDQLDKSLELNYPNQYIWEKGVVPNSKEYFSKIIIYKSNDKPKKL